MSRRKNETEKLIFLKTSVANSNSSPIPFPVVDLYAKNNFLIVFSHFLKAKWYKSPLGARTSQTTTMENRTVWCWMEVATGCGTMSVATWTTCTLSANTVSSLWDQCQGHVFTFCFSVSSIFLRLPGCQAKHHCHGQEIHSGGENPIRLPQGPLIARSSGTDMQTRWNLERFGADLQM